MSESLPVSVIIPTFNRQAVLERAIHSIRAQTQPPAEIIVSDDCSTDGTVELARRLGATVLVADMNRGSGPARNAAIAAASQPWVAFLDSDDEWTPEHLEDLWPSTGVFRFICASAIDVKANGSFGRIRGNPRERQARLDGPMSCVLPQPRIVTSGVLLETALVREVGGFRDFRRAQDLDLWLRCLEKTQGAVLPQLTVRYHLGPDQASLDTDLMKTNVDRIFDSYADRPWLSCTARRAANTAALWDQFRAQLRSRHLRGAAQPLARIALDPVKLKELARLLQHRRLMRSRTERLQNNRQA